MIGIITTTLSEKETASLKATYRELASAVWSPIYRGFVSKQCAEHQMEIMRGCFGSNMFADIDISYHPCPHRVKGSEWNCKLALKASTGSNYDVRCHYLSEPCRDSLNPNRIK